MTGILSTEKESTEKKGCGCGSGGCRCRRVNVGAFFNVARKMREGTEKKTDGSTGFISPGGFVLQVLNNISAAVFIVDDVGHVRAENAAFRKLFNTAPGGTAPGWGDVMGCGGGGDMRLRCGSRDTCAGCSLREAITLAINLGEPTRQKYLQHPIRHGDDSRMHHFQFSVDRIAFEGSDFAAVVMEDVTELYDNAERLEKLNRMKNEFLGMVAHDLRTPISLVRGFSSILKEKADAVLPPDDQQLLDVIFTQSDFALFLLDDLLDISELESGKVNLDLEEADYWRLIQESIRLNRPFTTRKNMSVFVNCNSALPILKIDRRKIEQVLNNLIANAVKYSSPDTEIHISVDSLPEGGVITRIRDQGQGIPEDELEKIFDGFQKGRSRPTGGEKSTGLGLMIAKRIVDAHGGEIGVKSELGKWAEFYFRLPEHPPEQRGSANGK